MTGNVTIDDFCCVCKEFNLEYHAIGEAYVMYQKNIGICSFGSIATYDTKFKYMTVSHGIRVINIQNNRTHEKIFSILNIKVI